MKCKICKTNDTDSTTGICWECCNKEQVVNTKNIDSINITEKDIVLVDLFHPYSNLIDWALNRHT